MKAFLISMTLVAALGAAVFFYIGNELDAQHVVLRFDRASSVSCLLCDVDVFVNGVKIGSVGNGRVEKFRLLPNADNTYEIEARLIPAIGPNLDTAPKKFTAEPGSVVYARFEMNPWVLKWMSSMKLDVAIESSISHASRYLPAPLSESGSKLVAKLDDPWSKLPWDAIGAIAGVVSGIAAIAALFK